MKENRKKMVPGFEYEIDKKEPIAPIVEKKTTITKPVTNDYPAIVYNDISRKYLEEGIKLAEERLRSDGIDVDHHPFFKQIREDAAYKEAVLKNMMKKIREYIARQQQLETTMGN